MELGRVYTVGCSDHNLACCHTDMLTKIFYDTCFAPLHALAIWKIKLCEWIKTSGSCSFSVLDPVCFCKDFSLAQIFSRGK